MTEGSFSFLAKKQCHCLNHIYSFSSLENFGLVETRSYATVTTVFVCMLG